MITEMKSAQIWNIYKVESTGFVDGLFGTRERRVSRKTPYMRVKQPQVPGSANSKGKTKENGGPVENQFTFGHINDQFTRLSPSLNSVLKLETVMQLSFNISFL